MSAVTVPPPAVPVPDAEVLAYEIDHPEDPWTPEVLARFGPETPTPF